MSPKGRPLGLNVDLGVVKNGTLLAAAWMRSLSPKEHPQCSSPAQEAQCLCVCVCVGVGTLVTLVERGEPQRSASILGPNVKSF